MCDMSMCAVTQMQSLPPNVAGGVVYQPGAPPSYPGTFSPAGSVEGSPMHNIYMNQPGQTAPPQYQAMPGAATGKEVKEEKTWKEFFTILLTSSELENRPCLTELHPVRKHLT